MASKVPDGSIRFVSMSRASQVVPMTRVIEDDETITMTDGKDSVTLVKSEDPNRVTRRTLTRNEVPPKREGKRKHHPHRWSGEEFTKNHVRAAYSHVSEDGVERDILMTGTRPEEWRGTMSPELTSEVIEGEVPAGYQDPFWRAV